MRTTQQQGRFIRVLAANDEKCLGERVVDALGSNVPKRWHDALHDLITILGDFNANYIDIDRISDEQMEAMRRNWSIDENEEQELRTRIIELRLPVAPSRFLRLFHGRRRGTGGAQSRGPVPS